VRATFFVVGQNAEKYPNAIQRMAAEGHETGNHTYSHEVLPLKPPKVIRDEIRQTSSVIERVTGRRPALFRAPHGWRNPWVNRTARASGCTPVAWTLGVWDTDRPGAGVIVQRAVGGARNGCILLLHDGRGLEEGADSSQLIEALPRILDDLKRRGYRFVTVSEMLEQKNR
jgi:peptidoglycan/xylan/chitin deacetylase (PgdA/CDA1 family)